MAIPAAGQWVVGTDKSGKLYLFEQGSKGPGGVTGSYTGLTHYQPLTGSPSSPTFGTQLHGALASLEQTAGITGVQESGITQAVDAGAIMQGGSYVAIPRGQQSGQTKAGQGQKQSASEAVSAGVDLPGIPGLNLSSIEQFAVRVLEALVGVALVALALQALAGAGDGSPVTAVKKVARVVR